MFITRKKKKISNDEHHSAICTNTWLECGDSFAKGFNVIWIQNSCTYYILCKYIVHIWSNTLYICNNNKITGVRLRWEIHRRPYRVIDGELVVTLWEYGKFRNRTVCSAHSASHVQLCTVIATDDILCDCHCVYQYQYQYMYIVHCTSAWHTVVFAQKWTSSANNECV